MYLVPDPLLLRKSVSAGNRTRDLWICSQELCPLDRRGGSELKYIHVTTIWKMRESERERESEEMV
jgi:hypothetical protein